MRSPLWVLVPLGLSASAAFAQAPTGPEFQVNTYTTNIQYGSSIASDGNGNFVVVWTTQNGQDGDQNGIFGQRYNASATPLGPEFRVNTFTAGQQTNPSLASDANGNFVVAWASQQDPDGAYTNYGIYAQRYDMLGNPVGGEFRVNTYTSSSQNHPAIASAPDGGFIVVWDSYSQDGAGGGVFGQRFDATGTPQGGEFQVNTYTTGSQDFPAVAIAPTGKSLVVWDSGNPTQDGDSGGIFGRCYDAGGAPISGEFRVNTYTTGGQFYGRAAADGLGRFIIVWDSFNQDGSDRGVYGQRLDAACAPLGPEFQANTFTTSRQDRPRVAADRSGNFTVAWDSFGQDGPGYGVFARQFNASGVPQGGEALVNTYTTGVQAGAAVAASPDGDFIVAWHGEGPGNDTWGIYARRYGDIIFQDDFESDSLVHWSSSSIDGGDLKTSLASAMAGSAHGLRARVNDTNSLFVQDDTPNAEPRYRVRFYFRPNGFDPGEASGHFRARLFLAQGGGLRLVTLVLKRQGGAYSVEARVRRNDGTRVDTGFLPITDALHILEFDWRKATGPGTSDGSLELWIDDVSVATLPGLDNDSIGVDQGRLGALSLKTGAAGTLYFDQFESRRLNHIGPE